MNISSLKCHLSLREKQKTVLPCVNFMRGERDYGRWDLMVTLENVVFSTIKCLNSLLKT